MRKEAVLRMILKSIFLVVFNALFFTLGGTDHNATVWISYGFIHFAYFMLLLTPKLASTGHSAPVFKVPIYIMSTAYFFVELIIGSLFIVIASEGYTIPFLVQFCIAGIYGAILMVYLIADEWTGTAEKERGTQIAFIKDASLNIKGLLEKVSDKEAKKRLERVYDALYSSPVKSHPDLETEENNILQSIRELADAVSIGNNDTIIALADTLEVAVNDRNKRLETHI